MKNKYWIIFWNHVRICKNIPGRPSMDILVRSCQDLGKILAKILPRYCQKLQDVMVRFYQESHVPKKFFVKSCLGRKDLKESQQKYSSMQIYIVRHDNFLLARYKIWLKSAYAVYLGRHWLNCSINSKTGANNGVRKASSWIITQNGAMTAVSSSNRTEYEQDMNLKNSRISNNSV